MLNGTIPLSSKTIQPGARPTPQKKRSRGDSERSGAPSTLRQSLSIDTATIEPVFSDDQSSPSRSDSLDSLCDISSLTGAHENTLRRSKSASNLMVAVRNPAGITRCQSCLDILINGLPPELASILSRLPRPPSFSEEQMRFNFPPPRPVNPPTRHPAATHAHRTHVTNETFDLSLMPSSVKQAPNHRSTFSPRNSTSNPREDPSTASTNPYLMGFSVPPRPNAGRSTSEMMIRSRQMINSIPDHDLRASRLPLNPFPVKHRSTLIEREKRMGLRLK